jgi:hypothetical protein
VRNLNLIRRHAGKPGAVERAAAALRNRGVKKPIVTVLEAQVLAHVSLREDPWYGVRGRVVSLDASAVPSGSATGGSRKVSQALSRLCRKGLVDRFPRYNITSDGEEALAHAFRWALYHRIVP